MDDYQHSPSACDCKSGNRTLVLLAKNSAEVFREFPVFGPQEQWFHSPEFGIIQIEVGTGKRFSGAADVFRFLCTTVFDASQLDGLRAAWLDRGQPLTQQLARLETEAEPFSQFAPDPDSSELLEILQNRRLETWFQPVIEARTGEIWGYECLMRGRRRDGTLVGALQLLEWARQENLKCMLDRACRETHLINAGKLNYDSKCRFLINFLPAAIYQPECCLQISLSALRRSGLLPRQVIFEVVETEKVVDVDHLLGMIDFYRRSGFGVAFDDMGSGYAELGLLGDLQPDLIKIDREVVSKSIDSESHYNICASLVRTARDNGQLVLAEGVESEDEVSLMESLGVDLFQGYYFGKPQPQVDFLPARIPHEIIGAIRSMY